ncbi:hypothetical protein QBC38DRAFT_443702 [Podospora fimiseda]|uniref:Macro domain-containing protein n=1 Tax=Podospora fimiseda TaxID=252190 RepID=A0AAN7BQ01_9PEZI|nr:hypothetical protein QBC38DRAFT_443702 [Podospora fimiseda]
MTVIQAADIPPISLLYKLNKLQAAVPGSKPIPTILGPNTIPEPSKALNDRVAVLRGDITTIAADAIVNAANRSLLGGGGVDGAIHRAAGSGLYDECKTLNGCPTGSAKITDAYALHCRKIIHAVGPVYDPIRHERSEEKLIGCYNRSLELAVEHNCRTIAFSGISTGIYGYPSREAAPAALSAVRKFLTGKNGKKIDKVIFVTFERKDVDAYDEAIPLYFPPVAEDATVRSEAKDNEAELDAKAETVAHELPDAPTSDPADSEHIDKKVKHEER